MKHFFFVRVCSCLCFSVFRSIQKDIHPLFFTLTPPRPKIDFGKWFRSRHDDVRFFCFFRLFDFVLFYRFRMQSLGFFPPNIFHIFTVGKWGGKFLQSHVAWVKVELCSVDYPSLNPFADCNGTFLFRVGVTLSWTFENGLRSINNKKKTGLLQINLERRKTSLTISWWMLDLRSWLRDALQMKNEKGHFVQRSSCRNLNTWSCSST